MKTRISLRRVWGLACLMQCLFFVLGTSQVETRRGMHPYVPIITEISPFGNKEGSPWIELSNPTSKEVDASRLVLVINDDFVYNLPKQLSKVPPRSIIVILLDGKESRNRYIFKNNSLVLHSPLALAKAMKPGIGQIAVYESTPKGKKVLVDFVSWGAPGSSRSLTRERNQIWKKNWFINPQPSFGDYDRAAARKKSDYIFGRQWGSYGREFTDWVVYSKAEGTPGSANGVPQILLFTLSDKATVRSEDIAIGWTAGTYAKSYEFQIASDSTFARIIEDVVLSTSLYKPKNLLPEGLYYYRVRVIDRTNRQGPWSRIMQVTSKKMKAIRGDGSDGAVETVLAAMQYRRQRKDSQLLCLDGCASDLDVSTSRHWDNVHPDAVPTADEHGNMNCVRASISMMVSFYGKSLCQDRIAYFTEEENTGVGNGIPEGDLAHQTGMAYSTVDGDEETVALEWALDATTTFMNANPTFAQIRGWIDASQPIMTRRPGHLRAMNGYRVDDAGTEWVHIMDPWSGERWETYATWNGAAQGTWVGPVSAPTARNDETTISADSDGDGIMDFDEQVRFMTGRFDKDSDNDAVDDKNDIREYVFDAADAYAKRDADFDLDGIRKEIDPDNDGDTFNDGCEDKNFNGKCEPALGETNNFAVDATGACAKKPIHAITVFDRSGSMVYPPSDPVKKFDRAAEAATLFLDTWLANDVPDNSKVGLVFYDHTSYFGIAAGANTGLDLLNSDKRDNIVAAFLTNRPNNGRTSIGGGISKAMDPQGYNTAGISADDQYRVMIVLTDGMENTPPFMDDPAVTSALSNNKVDGFVLGIGDNTEIDVDKLNDLADILNHPPASLATDMDAFQIEKFFLQVLAQTQGMEFSSDPVEEISVGGTKTHAIRVNAGASSVTFVIAWNELNGRITFTLKDPNGHSAAPDVTKSHDRYQVSVKRSPLPGLWSLTINASAACPPPPASIRYSLMSLEKNTTIRSNFLVHASAYSTGTPMLLTADLYRAHRAVPSAAVKVEVTRPRVGTGTFISAINVMLPLDSMRIEKDALVSATDKKLMAMSGHRMSIPVTTEAIVLNDEGKDGDEIAGDGRYSAYYRNTSLDGIYSFHFTAVTSAQGASAALNREKLISVPIGAVMYPPASLPSVKMREYRIGTGDTYIRFVVTPRDRFNNKIGPGKGHLITTNVKGKILKVADKLDGSYEVEMSVNGKYDNDILVLPGQKSTPSTK